MDGHALALIFAQLSKMSIKQLKNICRTYKEKQKRVKISHLKKKELILAIMNWINYSEAILENSVAVKSKPKEEMNTTHLIKRMNILVEITCEKRMRGEDTSAERSEYLQLKRQLFVI